MKKNARRLSVAPQFHNAVQRIAAETGRTPREQTTILARLLSQLSPQHLETLFPKKRARKIVRKAVRSRMSRHTSLLNSKRGDLEIITFPIFVFVAAVLAVVFLFVASGINDGLQGADEIPADFKESSAGFLNGFPKMIDFIVVLLAFVLGISSIWVSSLIPSHPMFVLLVLPFLLIGSFIAMPLGNAWESFSNDANVAQHINDIRVTDFLVSHLLEYFVLIIVISSIAFYSSLRGGQE